MKPRIPARHEGKPRRVPLLRRAVGRHSKSPRRELGLQSLHRQTDHIGKRARNFLHDGVPFFLNRIAARLVERMDGTEIIADLPCVQWTERHLSRLSKNALAK